MAQEPFKTSDELADAILVRATRPVRTGFRLGGTTNRWFNMAAEAATNEATAANSEIDFNLAIAHNNFADRLVRAAEKAQNAERFR